MTNSRIVRGRQTEEIVARWMREHGAPDASRVPASLPGVDIRGIPGLAIEVKATSGNMTGALIQAVKNAKDDSLPLVVWRPSGYGFERLASWPVIFRLEDATDLLVRAGYLS